MINVIGPTVWYVYIAVQGGIDSDSSGMSLKSLHVLSFAQRILTILKSCLVAASLKAVNPFLRAPSAGDLWEMRPFELEEQWVPFERSLLREFRCDDVTNFIILFETR